MRKAWTQHRVPLTIGAAVLAIVVLGGVLFVRASARTNKVALDAQPRGVTTVLARTTTYRPTRRYIGTVQPWVQAKLGPQFTSAYVATVLVRPGDVVKRGQVIATLDCRNASAQSQAIAMQARALEAKQQALSNESGRVAGLVEGGFVSTNEAEMKAAESASKQAELLATNAKMLRASLEVNDCILRAPFDGEIAERMIDPGAFVRPATPIATIVDRKTLRISADVPENDFAFVAPGSTVNVTTLATNAPIVGKIARRSPSADSSTRTIHFEIDVADPERKIPVGTTAVLTIEVGTPTPATEIPLVAASVRGGKATLYVVEDGVAKKFATAVQGEVGGSLFVDTTLKDGAQVVSEGRSLLKDGDRVAAKAEVPAAASATTSHASVPGAKAAQ